MKLALKYLSFAFFGLAIAIMLFGGDFLFGQPDCNPRQFLGCGILDVGLSGVIASMMKFTAAAIVAGLGASLFRLATGAWPKA